MSNRYMKDSDWANFKNFKKSEFKCKCKGKYCNGYPNEIAYSLVEILQKLRDHYGKAITISSGLRCKTHNEKVGGVSNSKHMTGQAADFSFKGMNKQEVINWLKKQTNYSYAYTNETNMKGAVHIDTKLTQEPKVEEKKEEPKIDYETLYKEELEKNKTSTSKISNLEAQISKLEADNGNLRNKVNDLTIKPKLTYLAAKDITIKFKIKNNEKMIVY